MIGQLFLTRLAKNTLVKNAHSSTGMISIFFSVNVHSQLKYKPFFVSADEILKNPDAYIPGLYQHPYIKGQWGRLTIKMFKYKFTIEHEHLFGQFVIHKDAILAAVNNECYRHYFQEYDFNYLTFDYVDCKPNWKNEFKEEGIRIRHFGKKDYEDSRGLGLYRSNTDYLVQEIIVPKREYIEKMIACIRQYLEYRKLVDTQERWVHFYPSWIRELEEAEAQLGLGG